MFDLLMKRQGQRLLRAANWPGHLEWQWRLSHCQGDGCALYGWLACDHLLTLLAALAQRQGLSAGEVQHLTTLLTLYDITVALQRNALSSRYSHAGCITPVVEGFPHDEFLAYTSFCQALQQDIRDLCQQAEQTGYRLLDATTPHSLTRCCSAARRSTLNSARSPICPTPRIPPATPPLMTHWISVWSVCYCTGRVC
ncbi:hypothetical protein KG918_003480 [Salmonella enterica]|nr:hypothetical protein [Salmonella enterica]EEF4030859.1 hypothetical protein [Salmonella enterica]EEJ5984374.1 hypothetical protein [Salmonella enterica]EEL9687870.1 hypothetical protein [Salmonella enterica]EEU3911204.1 hypothetical protein [Salmonella enterica]